MYIYLWARKKLTGGRARNTGYNEKNEVVWISIPNNGRVLFLTVTTVGSTLAKVGWKTDF